MSSISIRSGGQTGIDRAAIDTAIACGLTYGGWCPHGGWAEDFPVPPGLLAKYPCLIETPSNSPEQRTAWNARDSNATLLIVRGDELDRSPGTQFTRQMAELVFLRPCLVVDLTESAALDRAAHWLAALSAALGTREFSLNVAGPRESETPGIYAGAKSFLAHLLGGDAK